MTLDPPAPTAPAPPAVLADLGPWTDHADPAAAVTDLYGQHALSLIRMAHIMLRNRAAAEDVVQEAFLGLYRRWEYLAGKDRALSYVRSSVLNGCRSVLRRRKVQELDAMHQPSVGSAEAAVLSSEERGEVVRALSRLPARQREVLVLGYYLQFSDQEISADLGVSPITVRSTRRRALAALGRVLREGS